MTSAPYFTYLDKHNFPYAKSYERLTGYYAKRDDSIVYRLRRSQRDGCQTIKENFQEQNDRDRCRI
jgi:hypothetical protein